MSSLSPAMLALMQAAGPEGFARSQCQDCQHTFYPPQSFCPSCLSPSVQTLPDAGEATVLSTVLIHRSMDPAFQDRLPLHVACVQRPDGASVFALAAHALPPGSPVRLRLREGLFHVDPQP